MTVRAAGTMFRDPDGRVLFTQRSGTGDHGGEWALPGGGIEGEETAAAAARREAEEELGPYPAGEPFEMHQHEFDSVDFTTFAHDVERQFSPKLNEEHTGHAWADPRKPPSPLHPGVEKMLGDVRSEAEARFTWKPGDLQVELPPEGERQLAGPKIDEMDENDATNAAVTLNISA